MNVFDPCASWDYGTPAEGGETYLPMVLRNGLGGGGGGEPEDKRLVLFEAFLRDT